MRTASWPLNAVKAADGDSHRDTGGSRFQAGPSTGSLSLPRVASSRPASTHAHSGCPAVGPGIRSLAAVAAILAALRQVFDRLKRQARRRIGGMCSLLPAPGRYRRYAGAAAQSVACGLPQPSSQRAEPQAAESGPPPQGVRDLGGLNAGASSSRSVEAAASSRLRLALGSSLGPAKGPWARGRPP